MNSDFFLEEGAIRYKDIKIIYLGVIQCTNGSKFCVKNTKNEVDKVFGWSKIANTYIDEFWFLLRMNR